MSLIFVGISVFHMPGMLFSLLTNNRWSINSVFFLIFIYICNTACLSFQKNAFFLDNQYIKAAENITCLINLFRIQHVHCIRNRAIILDMWCFINCTWNGPAFYGLHSTELWIRYQCFFTDWKFKGKIVNLNSFLWLTSFIQWFTIYQQETWIYTKKPLARQRYFFGYYFLIEV